MPRSRLDHTLKHLALDDPYSILVKDIKPVLINHDTVRQNEELYREEMAGKEIMINLPG